ncbi:hypothetical protein EI94DRAFT_1786657 [Lactarius quietus]|nr:hypothetical protein EI94DRAFT_1786657 [Lactarius quietus]
MSAFPSAPVADIRGSLGPAYLGLLFSTTLLGVTVAQTWWYFWYLVLNYGNVEALNSSVWALNIQMIFIVIIGAAVQSFVIPHTLQLAIFPKVGSYYARQVHILNKSNIFSIFIAFGLFYSAKQIAIKQSSSLNAVTWVSCVGLTADVVADLLIAGSMCWSLYHRKTRFAKTDFKIMALMTYGMISGLLTSILGVATIITFAVTNPLISLALFWVMSKCYVNSLLALLNSRDYIRSRDRSTSTADTSFKISSIRVDQGVAVTMHRPTTSEYGRSTSGHDDKPAFEIPKPDTNIIVPVQTRFEGDAYESSV